MLSYAQAKSVQEGYYVFKDDFSKLQNLSELTFDHFTNESVEVYGPEGTGEYLKDIGVRALLISRPSMKDVDNYPSFSQVEARLKKIAASYPNILKLFSIGKSVEGRDLWVMKISDNVGQDELEPEVKYISSMHGDEITGRELCLNLIEDLAKGYATSNEIRRLIDHTEIFIMPSMNPDGSQRPTRGNAKWVDLNRDFPDFTRDQSSTTLGRQPETKAVMNFQAERHFALSANFHGGAVVVNYPWDTTYDPHPFDSLVRDLSLKYAALNRPMASSSEFPMGVTNGAEWYVLKGGMQDWSYFWYDDLQVTIELSDTKWPSYRLIPKFYRDNKNSMIRYLSLVHQGFGLKRNFNYKVSITQEGGAKLGEYFSRDGEFYKVLELGKYTLEIENLNNHTLEKSVIEVDGKVRDHYL